MLVVTYTNDHVGLPTLSEEKGRHPRVRHLVRCSCTCTCLDAQPMLKAVCRTYYEELSRVDGEYVDWRETV
ncbi:hypothetical protein BKA56DRAFT_582255 [Ilyonectria sp. MPI-CAGE-AT-0026]|nr:hypothetical protein BKA56DRAFT_582255 [Ilyonectria sp. MPI-CAGE-AT-0026]